MSESIVGPWARDKLDRLEKYLVEYTKIMSSQVKDGWCKGFHYIDAFAGPGKHIVRTSSKKAMPRDLFRDVAGFAIGDEGQQQFLRGSPRVALGLKQPFTSYVFVEKSEVRAQELEALRGEYSELTSRIKVVRTDCNVFLRDRVAKNPKVDWARNRALVFLDPFGMQVNWPTIEMLAATQAIEILVNFPVGMAIQRLLLRKGQFTPAQRKKLDDYFGSP